MRFLLKENRYMAFKVGETVVYPHHGAAKIIAITTRDFQGEQQKFLKLSKLELNMLT